MIVAHLGIGLLILGITGSSVWQEEKISRMKINNNVQVNKYNIVFNNSEINYNDNLINDLQSLIKRSQNLKINQNLYKDLFN